MKRERERENVLSKYLIIIRASEQSPPVCRRIDFQNAIIPCNI